MFLPRHISLRTPRHLRRLYFFTPPCFPAPRALFARSAFPYAATFPLRRHTVLHPRATVPTLRTPRSLTPPRSPCSAMLSCTPAPLCSLYALRVPVRRYVPLAPPCCPVPPRHRAHFAHSAFPYAAVLSCTPALSLRTPRSLAPPRCPASPCHCAAPCAFPLTVASLPLFYFLPPPRVGKGLFFIH